MKSCTVMVARAALSVGLLLSAAGAPGSAAGWNDAAAASEQGGAITAITGRDAKSRALYISLIADMQRSGKAHAALAHLDAFEKLHPRAEDAAVLRAACLVDLADYSGASTIYTRLLRGREAAAASAGLGRIEALNGRWPRAAERYAQAVAKAPTSATYLNDYGFALLRAGKPGEALFRLRQAAELAPADTRVRNNLVLALAASGDRSGAERLLAAVPDETQRAELSAEIAAEAQRTAAAAIPAPAGN